MAQAFVPLKAPEFTEAAHKPGHAEVEGDMTFECGEGLVPPITGDTLEGFKVADFVHHSIELL